ncbi:MAG: hypothetical protein F4110_06665 [Acidimicrobiaceae bacterium]|nr:hypothetical protein [Acidimicrobiaceae bacterium]MYI53648.1 hypothetical protein [Acidimicrobiaceae bacterium]
MTEDQWRKHWDAERMFFSAGGESGKAWGNETIRVAPDTSPSVLSREFVADVRRQIFLVCLCGLSAQNQPEISWRPEQAA